MMKVYIVHYRHLSERLETVYRILEKNRFDIQIIRSGDGDLLGNDIQFANYSPLWESRINLIKETLFANVLSSGRIVQDYEHLKKTLSNQYNFSKVMPAWMRKRDLTRGEISVLLKHFYGLCSIANGDESHGLIVEDDILEKTETGVILQGILNEINERSVDYVDVAGGVGLQPSLDEISRSKTKMIISLASPRTRTTAAYIISKRMARQLADHFFPLCFPIDWHYQFLFNSFEKSFNVGWAKDTPFIHGSETNTIKSWRE